MSMNTEEKVTCPQCKTQGSMEVWSSINNALNPEIAERLIMGDLFDFTCSSCGAVTPAFYPCLYHDMEHHVMIQLVQEAETQDAVKNFTKLIEEEDDTALEAAKYRYRIVTTHNALREKALAFKDGLNDMVVEISKAVLRASLASSSQIAGDEEMHYSGIAEDGTLMFDVLSEKGSAQVVLPMHLYNKYAELPNVRSREYSREFFVDENWAVAVLQES